jgi:hypothetical protein
MNTVATVPDCGVRAHLRGIRLHSAHSRQRQGTGHSKGRHELGAGTGWRDNGGPQAWCLTLASQ